MKIGFPCAVKNKNLQFAEGNPLGFWHMFEIRVNLLDYLYFSPSALNRFIYAVRVSVLLYVCIFVPL